MLVLADAGGADGAGAQTKNGDNTRRGGGGGSSEEDEEGYGGGGGGGGGGQGADTTLDISYPSARNPLTS